MSGNTLRHPHKEELGKKPQYTEDSMCVGGGGWRKVGFSWEGGG
jgi:hypothetical protein